MALPIWAYFMKRVYRDRMLGLSQDTRFAIPSDFNPCEHTFQDEENEGTSVEDVFE